MRKLILDSNLCPDKSKPVWLFETIPCFRYRVNTVILPLSYDVVNSNNNVINYIDSGGAHSATIPRGTYSITQFAPAIGSAMTTSGSQTYTVTYDTVTSKLTITAPGTFQMVGSTSSSYDLLGLNPAVTTAAATSYTSANRYDLSGVKFIMIASTSLRSEGILYVGDETFNIVEVLPIKQDLSTVMVITNEFQDDWITSKTNSLTSIDLVLLDGSTKKALDLQGEPFVVILDIDEER